MGTHAITTGKMLGGSGAGYTSDWLYVSKNGGAWLPTYYTYDEDAHGKLMNFRMIQAIWNNENTRATYQNYPHDPAANTAAFIAELPNYKSYGMLACTVGLQGGGIGNSLTAGNASAFNDDGSARLHSGTYANPGITSWWYRLKLVIEAMDSLGMFCIVNPIYFGQDQHFTNNTACENAIRETAKFLIANNYQNVLLDLVNEWTGDQYDHSVLNTNAGIVTLMDAVKDEYDGLSWRPPTSASAGGVGSQSGLSGTMAAESDILLPHGNLQNASAVSTGMAWHVANYDVPVIMNEDHPPGGGSYDTTVEVNQTNLTADIQKMQACWNNGGSWGGMIFGYNQAYPFQWAVGSSPDISGGSEANYFRAVLDGMYALVGDEIAPVVEDSAYSNTATVTTFSDSAETQDVVLGSITSTSTVAAPIVEVIINYEPQITVPESTLVAGNWTAVNAVSLHAAVSTSIEDETSYITSEVEPANDSCTFLLAEIGVPLDRTNHVLAFKYRSEESTETPATLHVELLDGPTVIADTSVSDGSGTFVTATLDLTENEAALIEDYTNLRVRFTANTST